LGEEQAIQRVHRIGQTRPVTVTRYLCEDTIEQHILEMQERKDLLGNASWRRLTKDEQRAKKVQLFRSLFAPPNASTPVYVSAVLSAGS
jgi:SWI/SNF-related matrix-associated actin-dependent regulator of chromatin subfamily A3